MGNGTYCGVECVCEARLVDSLVQVEEKFSPYAKDLLAKLVKFQAVCVRLMGMFVETALTLVSLL